MSTAPRINVRPSPRLAATRRAVSDAPVRLRHAPLSLWLAFPATSVFFPPLSHSEPPASPLRVPPLLPHPLSDVTPPPRPYHASGLHPESSFCVLLAKSLPALRSRRPGMSPMLFPSAPDHLQLRRWLITGGGGGDRCVDRCRSVFPTGMLLLKLRSRVCIRAGRD